MKVRTYSAVRSLLLKALGLGQKIPAGHYGIYKDVKIPLGYQFDNADISMVANVSVLKADGNRRRHRIMIICPDCGRGIPAGRIGQHYKVHPNSDKYPHKNIRLAFFGLYPSDT